MYPSTANQDWSGAESLPIDWALYLGAGGALLFSLLFAALFLRGLLQRGRYRAVSVLGTSEREEIATEIATGEERTSGEVVVVVLERSDRHPASEWVAGAASMLLGSALLAAWLPWNHPLWFFAVQIALGVAGFLAARATPGFKRMFINEERASEMAEEQALQEFYGHGLHRTVGATGVLLFVSLLERRVVVLGDAGIDAVLDASDWEATDEAILAGIRAGSLMNGLVEGVRRCLAVLEEHFPAEGENPNEVPDHVIVRIE